MKTIFKSIVMILVFFNFIFAQKYVKDREGKKYKTVKIGNQVWMTENLNTKYFRNGDKIPEAKTMEEWRKAAKERRPAWCYFNNDSKNGKKLGKLYNWYAVNDSRGLAPDGWRLPTRTDIEYMVKKAQKQNKNVLKLNLNIYRNDWGEFFDWREGYVWSRSKHKNDEMAYCITFDNGKYALRSDGCGDGNLIRFLTGEKNKVQKDDGFKFKYRYLDMISCYRWKNNSGYQGQVIGFDHKKRMYKIKITEVIINNDWDVFLKATKCSGNRQLSHQDENFREILVHVDCIE